VGFEAGATDHPDHLGTDLLEQKRDEVLTIS
jgi:hypothetical protein